MAGVTGVEGEGEVAKNPRVIPQEKWGDMFLPGGDCSEGLCVDEALWALTHQKVN